MDCGASKGAPRVYRALTQARLVAPVRLVLGSIGVAAATARGLGIGHALAEAAAGAGLTIFALVVPGGRTPPWRSNEEPAPTARDALVEPWWRTLAWGMFPSTYGVTVLAAIALVVHDGRGLAAFLAGVLAGMGLLTLVVAVRIAALERALGGRLLVDRSPTRRRYVQR